MFGSRIFFASSFIDSLGRSFWTPQVQGFSAVLLPSLSSLFSHSSVSVVLLNNQLLNMSLFHLRLFHQFLHVLLISCSHFHLHTLLQTTSSISSPASGRMIWSGPTKVSSPTKSYTVSYLLLSCTTHDILAEQCNMLPLNPFRLLKS